MTTNCSIRKQKTFAYKSANIIINNHVIQIMKVYIQKLPRLQMEKSKHVERQITTFQLL